MVLRLTVWLVTVKGKRLFL